MGNGVGCIVAVICGIAVGFIWIRVLGGESRRGKGRYKR